MADLFTRNRKEELCRAETKILNYAAWCMGPVNLGLLSGAGAKLGLTLTETKKCLNEIVSSGKLLPEVGQATKSIYQNYSLPVDLHLQLLWELKDASPKTILLMKSIYYYSPDSVLQSWRNFFLAYASLATVTEPPSYFDSDYIIINLCRRMASHPYWAALFQSFPDKLIFQLFEYEQERWDSYLCKPDNDFMRIAFWENEKLSVETRLLCRDHFSFFEYVLSGRLNEILSSVSSSGTWGRRAHALFLQYQGQYKEAIGLYRMSLKELGESFFMHPFYDMAYVLALMSDGTAESKKKISVLAKKKELRYSADLLHIWLLICFSLHESIEEPMMYIEVNYPKLKPLTKVLVALVLHHFHLLEKRSFNLNLAEVQQLVDQDYLKLLQLEYSQDFSLLISRSSALRQEIGQAPLLPPFKVLAEWEKSIELLLDLTESKKGSDSVIGKSETRSRIIYYIGLHGDITPRLQKSKDGVTWSKGRNIALTTFKQQGVSEMTEVDRRLSACVRSYSGGWGVGDYSELDGPAAFAVLAGYPFVFQAENPDVPVVITKEEPQIVMTKANGGYRMNVNVNPPYDASVVLKKENDQLYRVFELTPLQRKILDALQRTSYYPVTAKAQLVELLNRLSRILTVHSDLLQSDEQLKTVKGSTLITVQLQPIGDGIKAELFVKPLIEQPPYCKAGQGASGVIGAVNGKRVQIVRNLPKEKENFAIISRLLQKVSGDKSANDVLYFDDYYQCLELIDALREQTKIARTEWPEGVKFFINRSADFSHLNLSLKSSGKWFEVEGELKIDARTQLKIGELLQKICESKGRFIALGDSEFLALSQQLRHQLEEIDAMFMRDKKKLQLSPLHASSIVEMEQLGISLTKDKAFTALQKRMEEAGKEKYVVPKNLQAELRGYQEDGFRWMSRLAHWGAGACLADDMGLGKTIQSLALLLSRGKRGASLVIAPASVMLNWKSEIERFSPSLTAWVMHDADCDRKKLVESAAEFDIVLTTYGLLIKEAELLASREWNVIILDEAHTIKNKETKMSKAAMELHAEFRLLLTGTPLQNHLGEIWNLFQFANPGLLGSFQHFNENFIQPIEKGEDKQRQIQLKKIVQPFLLRRTKAQVLNELPEKTEITLSVELSEEERALYENIRQQAMLNLEENSSSAMQALAEITRLRQAACHPALVHKELNMASSKTQAFLKLTDELVNNNHRALVFSQFTSHLALIRQELDAKGIDYLYLDGSISVNERAALVKTFQTGEQPLFLISLKAGGTGLNLTAADYVIHLDPWWNPAVEDQASDRAHRIGQTRPVTIYRLISAQTIEEKIIQLHQTKKSLADSLLDGSDIAHKLTKEDMLALLRGGDYELG